MELVYVWIEEYKGITNLGFNISNRYDIKYKNDLLEIKEYENWKSKRNFYSKKVNNVTALIGKNGSGKSTLIDFISSKDKERKGFMIYLDVDNVDTDKNNVKIFIDFNLKDKINFKQNIKIPVKSEDIQSLNLCGINGKFHLNLINKNNTSNNILYYDNSINSYQVNRNSNVIDISTSGLLTELGNNTVPLRSNDLKNILTFFKSDNSNNVLKILELTKNNNNFHKLMKNKDIILKVSLPRESENKTIFLLSFINNVLDYFSYTLYFNLGLISNEDIKLVHELLDHNGELESLEDYEVFLNENFKDHENVYYKNLYTIYYKLKVTIESSSFNFLGDNSFEIKFENTEEENQNVNNFIDFLEVAKEDSIGYHFFEYTWSGLSSGEEHFITFFSRIYSKIEKLKEEKNILFVLDEPETFLHPEWSRQFLSLLVTFLDEIFKNDELNIQLIISSHSPYLASDMAREDIILLEKYLDKVEEKEKIKLKKRQGINDKTLGANIHELYRGPFFMESTMGEFALSKIKGVIEDLTTLECFKRKMNINVHCQNL